MGLAVGAALLALLPLSSGLAGYLLPIVSMTVSYALFQTANNTAVMQCAAPSSAGAGRAVECLAQSGPDQRRSADGRAIRLGRGQ